MIYLPLQGSKMEGSTILVIGSTNTDLVVRSPRFPKPGETLVGSDFATYAGGKGANQAVAAARLSMHGGSSVRFIAKVGRDDFGKNAKRAIEAEGMNTQYWFEDDEQPSGTAVITVDDAGENTIVVVPGANGTLSPADLERQNSAFVEVGYLLLQLETPLATVAAAADHANALKIPVVLNPAPAQHLEDSLLEKLSLITPNETEAEVLTGISTDSDEGIKASAQALSDKGVDQVVITLGSRGAYVLDRNRRGHFVSAPKVRAVDTTAAGDCFNGALVVALSEGMSLFDAVAFGCRAASLSVQVPGAQPSLPTRKAVDQTKND